MTRLGKKWTVGLLGAAALASGTMAIAQGARDPAYAAARSQGKIGEQSDGYLGVVGGGGGDLLALVKNINIQRKAVYTKQAASGGTVVERAFVAGCNLVQKTVPGEKYQAPDGSWKTRTSAPPIRDERCV